MKYLKKNRSIDRSKPAGEGEEYRPRDNRKEELKQRILEGVGSG
jgi:hypothetical protein